MEITINELRQMKHKEGMILQGCGGDIQEWVIGINELLTQEDILLEGTKFENVRSFFHEGSTNLLFPFEDVKLDFGKLAIWLSDYVANKLGGFLDGGPVQKTEEHKQSERRLDTPVQENEELGLGDILMR